MNGDTHNFYAVIMGTMVISLISGFNEAFGKGVLFGVATNIIAMLIYGLATLKDNAAEKERKLKPKTADETIAEAEKAKEHAEDKGISKAKKIAFLVLYFNVIVVCGVASFDSSLWFGANIVIAALGMVLVIAGAFTPDLDTLLFGVEVHRNPLSHSWVIPSVIWALGMIAIPNEWRVFNILTGLYCVGYASHLMLDTIPSTSGFWEGIKEFFAFYHAPGDIRGVPEKWEHPWLFCGAVALFAEFGTTIARFYQSHGFDYDTTGDWNAPTIAICILGYVAIGLWVGLMIAGNFVDKKHPTPRTKQGYSKRYYIPKNTTCTAETPKVEEKPVADPVKKTTRKKASTPK